MANNATDPKNPNMNANVNSNASPNTNANRATNSATNVFEQAADSFKTTMDASLKLQQDAFKNMMGCFTGFDRFDDVRQRIESVTNETVGMIRKNAERTQKLFDEQCRTGTEMMTKSFDSMKGAKTQNGNVSEQCRSAWKTGFEAMCSGIDAMAKANVQVVENWASLFDKTIATCEPTTAAK